MKARLVNYLQKNVQLQMLAFLLVSLVILTVAAGYLYILKKPFADFRQSKQTLELLENELQTGLAYSAIIASTQQNINQLDKKLNGPNPSLPVNQLIAFVIGELDSTAKKHQITLVSVKPEAIENKLFFHELPFVIEISGSYLDLYEWLDDVEKNLGTITVKKFAINATNTSSERHMQLTLVSYRFEGENT